jgi:hypothetical protein
VALHVVWEQDGSQNLRACKTSLHPHHGAARAFWLEPEGSHDYPRVLQRAISSLSERGLGFSSGRRGGRNKKAREKERD